MISSSFLLPLLACGVFALQLAQPVPQFFDPRGVTSGGWSLQATSCPVDNQLCSGSYCCPASMDCVHVSPQNHCCPKGTTCQAIFVASPQCADDGWSLWNKTTVPKGQGYFCCLPGQIGTNSNNCVAGGTPVVATLSAELLSSATGGVDSSSTPTASPSNSKSPATPKASTTRTGTSETSPTSATSAETSKSAADKLYTLEQVGYIGGFAFLVQMML
ncbi:uncharacterized protein BP5553_06745 [Venustampulla echinocandica]|uniref:Granulins domain-containing protein n=1 Tax=Venustampulla echinocandica TaxID=2656787 RepID=A0A370TKS7_9HELO|nr:uncharacterized protein BP5553_06745 [Venustampulla echinocandica]RDL36133.1 hypothetical protein BP5553_06745 [Venustampulla echinocandica]